MASEEMRAAAKAIREAAVLSGTKVDVAALRQTGAEMALPLGEGISRRDFDRNGISGTHIEAPGARNDRAVLYFHGGGYVLGSLDTHAELMGRISSACRAPVLGIDYRLAPEHVYPAALEDAVASYELLLANGIQPERIVIAGDSAGGGLSLACMLALRASGTALPAGAVLFSPWTDLTGSGDSQRSRADVEPMISPALLEPMATLYRGDVNAADPGISPLFADLAGLPPLLIQVGDHEILLDDSTRLASAAALAGVEATLEIYDEGFHVFQNIPDIPEAAEALTSVGRFFDEVTS